MNFCRPAGERKEEGKEKEGRKRVWIWWLLSWFPWPTCRLAWYACLLRLFACLVCCFANLLLDLLDWLACLAIRLLAWICCLKCLLAWLARLVPVSRTCLLGLFACLACVVWLVCLIDLRYACLACLFSLFAQFAPELLAHLTCSCTYSLSWRACMAQFFSACTLGLLLWHYLPGISLAYFTIVLLACVTWSLVLLVDCFLCVLSVAWIVYHSAFLLGFLRGLNCLWPDWLFTWLPCYMAHSIRLLTRIIAWLTCLLWLLICLEKCAFGFLYAWFISLICSSYIGSFAWLVCLIFCILA